jgi:hypothetical protein
MGANRLEALSRFERKPMPSWGTDLTDIDVDDIAYFVESTENQAESWEDLPEDIRTTYERLRPRLRSMRPARGVPIARRGPHQQSPSSTIPCRGAHLRRRPGRPLDEWDEMFAVNLRGTWLRGKASSKSTSTRQWNRPGTRSSPCTASANPSTSPTSSSSSSARSPATSPGRTSASSRFLEVDPQPHPRASELEGDGVPGTGAG